MILSREQIEQIGNILIQDFERQCPELSEPNEGAAPFAVHIEQFASKYLGLEVSMARLSPDGSICGLTAYADTEYQISDGQSICTIPLHQGQILLDISLTEKTKSGRRRFTLAHECAHQILFALEDTVTKRAKQKNYSERASYSLRELKTKEDWNEWQANALAAAMLMPLDRLRSVRSELHQTEPVKCYGTRLSSDSVADVYDLCDAFDVSRAAMLIRLRQLGAVDDRPLSEFYCVTHDPLEIWP